MGIKEQLQNVLFAEDGENAFAIIDGAACEELLEKLEEHRLDYCCLFAGELEPDMEACAPYLVSLVAADPITDWLLTELPGKPWGIFMRTPADFRQLRKHFRAFLIVKNEQGENMYFRYYDPRVIRIFLPTCDPDQFQKFFGPISFYLAEGEKEGFVSYRYQDAKLQTRPLELLIEPGPSPA